MRGTENLTKKTKKKADKLVKQCAKKGLIIKITDTLRTKEEQDELYAQGRTKPGNIVTYAKGSAYSSFHMWGLAFDFCRADGRPAFDNSDGFFDKVGKIGKTKCNLIWGGDWISPVDKPHFQIKFWGNTTNRIFAKYKTPENFWKKKPLVRDIKKKGK